MYILIDNTNDKEIVFFGVLNTKIVQDNFVIEQAGSLLVSLEKWLEDIGQTKAEIEGLGVVVGKGRFTNTRVAVTVANTLSFALGVPVVGLSDADVDVFVDKVKNTPVGQYVSAKYSGEAHIGRKNNK